MTKKMTSSSETLLWKGESFGFAQSKGIRNDKIKTGKVISDPGCYSPHFSSFRSSITITYAQKPLILHSA